MSKKKKYDNHTNNRNMKDSFNINWPNEKSCPDENTMALYLDDLLDNVLKAKFIKHLGLCDACKEQVEILKEIKKGLESRKEFLSLPKDIKQKAMDLFYIFKPKTMLQSSKNIVEIIIEWSKDRWELIKPNGIYLSHALEITRGKEEEGKGVSSWLVKKEFDTCIFEAYIDNIKDDLFILRVKVKDKDKNVLLTQVNIRVVDLITNAKEEDFCDGETTFEDIKPSVYKLELIKNETELGKIYLKIKKE